jgi:hypothetical protein
LSIFFNKFFKERAHNVPAAQKPLSRQSERFGGPDKEMRSISRAGKLCWSNGVGMERSGMT